MMPIAALSGGHADPIAPQTGDTARDPTASTVTLALAGHTRPATVTLPNPGS